MTYNVFGATLDLAQLPCDVKCCGAVCCCDDLQTSRMTFAELNIDPKFHRHIVGRNGANSQYCQLLTYLQDILFN